MCSQGSFSEIHSLLRRKRHSEVLAQVLDAESNKILEPFSEDLNHAWYIVGDIHYKAGNFVAAIDAFERSLADRPDDVEAILALGNSCTEAGEHERAESVFRQGLALDACNDSLLCNLANALFDRGKYDEAIDVYQRVSEADELAFSKAQRNIALAKGKRGSS